MKLSGCKEVLDMKARITGRALLFEDAGPSLERFWKLRGDRNDPALRQHLGISAAQQSNLDMMDSSSRKQLGRSHG